MNGFNGAVGPVILLSGSIPASGLFVLADRTGGGSVFVPGADLVANFDFQNGPDSIVLRGEGNDLFSLREVRCGATACRIRIQVADDPDGVPAVDPIMPDFLPWEAEAYMEADEHDPSQLVVYLAREGETLGARSDSRSPRG